MPISFSFDGDDVAWTQRFESPTIYLDTCGVREIAKSDELSARFAESLKAHGGTWLLSSLSISEFAHFADPRHVERAERLLAQVVPHVYFFWSDPADMRDRRGETDPAKRATPPADHRNMDYFSRRWAQAQSFIGAFSGVFQLAHERRMEMAEALDEIADKLVVTMTQSRQLLTYRSRAKAAHPKDGRSRKQIISGELLRVVVLDPKAKFTRNDAIDLMHAVDAVDYCDLALLDTVWAKRVQSLRDRIAQSGVTMPLAQAFSMGKDGVISFLEALEHWRSPQPKA
ncbi:hypothetical protein [Xanthomonas sp. 1678]|uniref:hypothetical protein n=1 Tax=Xanthomonas sp. 1678 TaxID=3158788 RepID=UPI0028545F86|nr:hypothetical protein [Xanthomonas translucens]